MPEVIGELRIKRYDNGNVEMDPGGYPSLENASYDAGMMLGEQIRNSVEGDPKENYVERRTLAHDMVKAFAHGLKADPAAITWINPKEDLPDNARMRVLFVVKMPYWTDVTEMNAKVGFYVPEAKEFRADPPDYSIRDSIFKINQVQCWMPYPYPISFEKN